MRFVEMRAAKAWGVQPDEWDELDADAKAEMIAVMDVEEDMAAFEARQQRPRGK